MAEPVVLQMDLAEGRALWHAVSAAVTLMDAVEAEPGNSIPPQAPLYGQRDRLIAVAQRLDHECNQAERPGEIHCCERNRTATAGCGTGSPVWVRGGGSE